MSKKISLLLISLTLSLGVAEFIVRKVYHINPGLLVYNSWFHEVDSLVVLKGFVADSNGVMKIDPEAAAYTDSIISHYTHETEPESNSKYLQNYISNKICLEIYALDGDYFDLKEDHFSNDLKQYVTALKAKPAAEWDDADSAVVQYTLTPLNSEGFRSIPFKKYRSKKKKILLLGDSFTFGHSASKITNSFADLLLAKGYIVYNTGITFTDPAQYLAVAKEYVPLLEPDYVVVNFFMGNDIIYYHRKLIPYKPCFYATNAAFFSGCPDGIYFDNANQAYSFVANSLTIPPKNLFNKLCRKSAIATLAWKAMDKHGFVDATPEGFVEYRKQIAKLKTAKPYSNIEVDSIRIIAEAYNSRFLLTVIPNLQGGTLRTPAMTTDVFDSIRYFVPKMQVSDYDGEGGHYNDSGHKKHAEFIDSLIMNGVR